jgi:peroxiredoxin
MRYYTLFLQISAHKNITELTSIKMRIFSFVILILISLSLSSCSEKEHRIDITITGLKNSSVIVGYYFNNKMKPRDTIKINNDGYGVLNTTPRLKQGVYFIYLPNKTYFNFLINNNQEFSIRTTLNNLIFSQNISGNSESELYLKYQIKVAKEYEDLRASQLTLTKLKKQTPEYDSIYSDIEAIKAKINLTIDSLITDKGGSLLAKVLQLSKEPCLPGVKGSNLSPEGDASTVESRLLQQYKTHYFDRFDLNDERLLYTPFFTPRLDFYFKTVVTQNTDSLIKESNATIKRSNNSEVQEYLIKYLFNMASTSQIPGIDAMIVDIAENYYFTGKASWVDSVFMNRLRNKIGQLKPSTLGQQAPDLMMKSSNEQYYRLSEVRAPLTLLLFWDPGCGHCKTQIPQIKAVIRDKYQKDGIKVFAVYTQPELKPWTDFIDEHDLYEWINVYDPLFKTKFWELYNIHSTPSFFVLDEDKKIIYKMNGDNFNIDQLSDFIRITLGDN